MKRVSHSTEGLGVEAALGKFDSSDSNERFWQMFTKVKIRKTKIWELEELKILFGVVEERILNIYKSQIKTSIKYYFYLAQQYAFFN